VSAARAALWGALAVAVGMAAPGEALARHHRAPLKISGMLNLATASAGQLELLPGIGPKAAKMIVEHRARAPFTRVEELVRVKGFGKKRFDRLRPYLTLNGATTLKVERLRAQGRANSPPK